MQFRLFWQAILFIAVVGSSPAVAGPNCPIDYGAGANAKSHKLFLVFPTQALPEPSPPFPSLGYDNATQWLPVQPFNPVQDLGAYTGTEAQLRDAIHDVVADIYCEFNVQVIQQSTLPTAADGPRRNTIAIGSDVAAHRDCNNPLRGQSKVEGGDALDSIDVDFSRVWAGAFQQCATGSGGALNGGNSTLQRWAESIGSTVAHEAAHNYGLSHLDGGPHSPGEDSWAHHLMRSGQGTYTWSHRAQRRHFSDFEYSKLAANIGLAMDTMWNWDFINPNGPSQPNAVKLSMEFLSRQPSIILSWSYSGAGSPWINPTVSGPTGTRFFQNVSYNVYRIEWSAGQTWSNGPSGQVPGQARFHVGATFSSVNQADPDAIIVTDVKLFDATGKALPQQPAWIAFDAAAFNSGTSLLDWRLFNLLDRPLILRDVVVRDLPRIMAIDAMMPDEPISDISGRVFQPWPGGIRQVLPEKTIAAGADITIAVADARTRPYILQQPKDCAAPPGKPADPGCKPGKVTVDLFPGTTMYITATIVDPDGQRWDATAQRFVTGAVETRLYYQIAGRRLPAEERLSRQP